MARSLLRMAEPFIALAVLFLLASWAAGPGLAEEARAGEPLDGSPARVILPEVAHVERGSGTVTLGEVARLEGPSDLTERLEAIPVGPAPLPGRSRWVEIAYLAVRLRQAGIDPKTVRLEGPERMELVTRLVEEGLPAAGRDHAGGTAFAVQRGETVVLEAAAGPVVVQVAARALHAARVGDRVPVVNLSSGRSVEAVVVAPGRVQVEAIP